MAWSIRHFGTINETGHIISTFGGVVLDHGPSPLPLFIVKDNIKALLGGPFKRLSKSISGFSRDKLEVVWNDYEFIDEVHGRGTYKRLIFAHPEYSDLVSHYLALKNAGLIKETTE